MPESPPARQGPVVLYVDDEKGNRVVFEASLKNEFNVITAADPQIALDILSKQEIAVVVTDMRMPTMNGEDLLRIVKERWPATTRMVLTAYDDVDPILRAINEGLVARYIIKPWVLAELIQVLRWATEAWTFSRDSASLHRRLMETERLATLGSIAGMLVHDLRQPLVGMMINLENLDAIAHSAPELREVVERAQLDEAARGRLLQLVSDLEPLTEDLKTSAEHLNTLIKSLRELGRPRDRPREAAVADPLPIVRHAMSVCQQLAVSSHASIEYDGPGQLPRVQMSPTELTQVLINVLSNGAQAVAARGMPNGKVSIHARTEETNLELQIHDDGVGMPPEVLKRVGTPFFTTRSEGTGLGVAQCQRLVGTAGGRFQIDSSVGIGTTVTIRLPIAS
ncbi:MAG TPA: ATP-binding protein [Kofleriaceae bacterium]|nr:ATP-binding protein [Kofleriaceae bacterium]